jgi:hypothetical protein
MYIKFGTLNISSVDFPHAAVAYQDGVILERYKAIINFTASKNLPATNLVFNAATGVITNNNPLDTNSFIRDYGLLLNEKIKVAGSALNTGEILITGLTDTTITTSTALTNETVPVAYVYVTSIIDAMDYYYNLIGNNEVETYMSKTDPNFPQKYTCKGLNAAPGTIVALNIGTTSNAWVCDTLAGIVSTSTITVNGSSGSGLTYVQSFTLTHYYGIAPFWLKEQQPNFATKTPPYYFNGSVFNATQAIINALQYIGLVNMKYNSSDTVAQYSGHFVNQNGVSSWFNQNNSRTVPEFTVASIAYADTLGNPLTANDFSKDVNVTIKIKSATGLFVNNTTKFYLKHVYCPLDPTAYQNTLTTLYQNFMLDYNSQILGSASVNGVNNGGNYQVLKNIVGTFVDVNNATITCTMSFSAFLKAILLAKDPSDRNYLLSVIVE